MQKHYANTTLERLFYSSNCVSFSLSRPRYPTVDISRWGGVCHNQSSHYGRAVNCQKLNVCSNVKNNHSSCIWLEKSSCPLCMHAHRCTRVQTHRSTHTKCCCRPTFCIIQLPEKLKCHSQWSSLDIIEDLPFCLMSVSFNETLFTRQLERTSCVKIEVGVRWELCAAH